MNKGFTLAIVIGAIVGLLAVIILPNPNNKKTPEERRKAKKLNSVLLQQMKKLTIEIEHNDAPSGYVTLYKYKEPFMPFETGFGYQGVLLFDGETDKVQCHFCGDWFDYLPAHIRLHGLKAVEYKMEVGLRKNTALISEAHREKLIANRTISLRNLIKGKKKTALEKKKISATVKANATIRQQQNEKGTCPYQMLDRIQKVAEELGRVPTTDEFNGVKTAEKLFGSWSEAVRLAGYQPRKVGSNIVKNKIHYSKESLVALLKEFKSTHNRFPTPSDRRRQLMPSDETFRRHFGSYQNALKSVK